jgi:hypothetical protein
MNMMRLSSSFAGSRILTCGVAMLLMSPISVAVAGTHGFKSLYSFQTGGDGAGPCSPLS